MAASCCLYVNGRVTPLRADPQLVSMGGVAVLSVLSMSARMHGAPFRYMSFTPVILRERFAVMQGFSSCRCGDWTVSRIPDSFSVIIMGYAASVAARVW